MIRNAAWIGGLFLRHFLWEALAVGVLFAAGAVFLWEWPPGAVALLILYAGVLCLFARPMLSYFSPLEATEWLIGQGGTRRDLVLPYVTRQAVRSVIHAAGFTGLWLVDPGLGVYKLLGWHEGTGVWKVFVGFVALQIIVRGIILIAANAPYATCLPVRIRDIWWGMPTQPFLGLGVGIASFLALLLMAALPIAAVWLMSWGAGLWLPAIAYGWAVCRLAASAEFVRVSRPDTVRLPNVGRGRPLRTAGRRFSPFLGLCWEGGRQFVIATLLVAGLFGALLSGLLMISWGGMTAETALIVGMCTLGMWIVYLVLFGGKLFCWTGRGSSAEYLSLRGVSLGTLRRLRLLSGLAITLLSLAFVAAVLLLLVSRRGAGVLTDFLRYPIVGALALATGHLLYWCNEDSLPFRRVARVQDLARLVRRVVWAAWLASVIVGMVAIRAQLLRVSIINLLGLLVFVPAVVLWVRAWVRSGDEQGVKEEVFS